ncbi:MAG: efflux RND transporter periplasmic adaptor subunit [Candidatus Zixiibacteriota bacterium]|nr:MAG: efflux RND transporter periplasmic adaptor subunit [candidate division Zixibacteria bacterium]
MSKIRLLMLSAAAMLILAILGGRILRQSRADALQDAYSSIVSVKGLVAQTETFTRRVEASGVLAGNKESLVAAETGGRVVQILADVGCAVRAGDPLVRLDDELYGLEAERARIAYEKAQLDLQRLESLYAERSVAESDLENARLGVKGAEVQYRMAQKTYRDATIRAPFAGTVAVRLTEVGQMVERGMPVAQLVDIASLKLTVQVSESEVGYLAVGAPALVTVDATGDTVPGEVAAIGSRARDGARTFPVEIRLAGAEQLRSGMFAHTVITSAQSDPAILLPRASLVPDAGNMVVFTSRGGQAEKHVIRQIGFQGDRVAVDGVAPGDTVITLGSSLLSHGAQVLLTLEEEK